MIGHMYEMNSPPPPARRALSTCPCDRRVWLTEAVEALRRRYGPGIIRLGADLPAGEGEDRCPLPTGSLSLDLITGGLPRGAITEYAGPEGCGKEILALAALARALAGGALCLLLDADGSADPEALAAAGVDLGALVVATPGTAAEGWHCLEALCRCGAPDLVALLSLPLLLALPGSDYAASARPLRRLALALRGRRTALLLTNLPLPGSAWRTLGEPVVGQVARVRVALAPTEPILGPHGDVDALGAVARGVKHHGAAVREAVPLAIGPRGPDRAAELLDLGRRAGLVASRGGLLCARGEPLGRTERRARRALEDDPALAARLERALREPPTGAP